MRGNALSPYHRVLKPLDFRKTIPLVKVEEGPNGLAIAYGLATSEAIDSDRERCNYPGTKPYYQKWAEKAIATTTAAGQQVSCGNIRVMHTGTLGGKATGLTFDDDRKQVWIKTEAADMAVSDLLRRGILTSFSQGGTYVRKFHGGPDGCGSDITEKSYCPTCQKDLPVVDYIAEISEVSYVDLPANPEATFSYVKADKSIELRKFADPAAVTAAIASLAKSAKTKRVAGEDLTAECFAYVGDPEDISTWKLPIKFSTEAKTKRHIRNALARFEQTQGIPANKKAKVKAKIIAAAKKHGIEVSDESEKAVSLALEGALAKSAEARGLEKGLYDVARFAEMVQSLAYLWMDAEWEADREGDESEVPAAIRDLIENAAEVLMEMTSEELSELTAAKAKIAELEKSIPTVKTPVATPATEGAPIMNEEFLKAARKGMAGFCKGMCKVHKAMADTHEKAMKCHKDAAAEEVAAGDSEHNMMEHYQAAVDHMGESDQDDVAGDPADKKTEREEAMKVHKAAVEHHKAKKAYHVAKAKHHEKMADIAEKMHKSHLDAHDKYTTLAESQGEGDSAKAAQVSLEKMSGPEAPPTTEEIVTMVMAKMVSGAQGTTTAIAADPALAKAQESITALAAQVATLTEKLNKAADPVAPPKLQTFSFMPLPGTKKEAAKAAAMAESNGEMGW